MGLKDLYEAKPILEKIMPYVEKDIMFFIYNNY
jgi:hypothetical protein